MDFSNLVFLASVAAATDTSCTPVVRVSRRRPRALSRERCTKLCRACLCSAAHENVPTFNAENFYKYFMGVIFLFESPFPRHDYHDYY